ncbi:MAG: DNA polymerase III subunit gamma/tau [Chitinophagia bacterium]|nr:DNA polymerase III subunit gamma/tau [Chitinophagia bacterium]
MENFVVSARKYRPQHFSTVVGQSHITTTLKNAILQNHLAHAFLFCGPRGVGKTTCARILAKTINCEKLGKDGEACDKCNSCKSFNDGASFNIHELDAASNNSVDDIRELIEQVRFAPQAGKYKIYIIDEVHMLSASAFNAFLKTLEEPPAHAIFILATTEKHKILPTILSRCQIFDFKRITPTDIVAYLEEIASKEKIKAENAAMQLIAQKSEGCMRDALSILDKIVSFTNGQLTYSSTLEHLNLLDEDYFFTFLELLQNEDLPGVLSLYDEIDQKGFEGDTVLNNFASFFRNLLISKDARSIGLLQVVDAFRKKYISTASTISSAYIIGALNILNEAEIGFKQARNKKLHVEFHLIRLTYLQQAVSLLNDGSSGKKKRLDEIKSVAFKQIGYVEQKNPPQKTPPAPKSTSEKIEASLKIDTALLREKKEPQKNEAEDAPKEAGALKKIREQILHRKQEQQTVHTLTESSLQEAWDLYLQKLQDNNQATSHHNLKNATLTLLTAEQFDVFVTSKIQYQFIETARINLLIHLQDRFNNPKIQFKISLDPDAEKETVPAEQTLSQRDQYLKMISLYPLVKEMRDQLNLDLDY